jgi:hypothetical protein
MGTVSTLGVGTATFSVYALTSDPLADANAYFLGHVAADEWTIADNNLRKKAIITAYRLVDRERYTGEKTSPSQATLFPRTNITRDAVSVASGTPDEIVYGQFELALSLLKDADVLEKNSTFGNISSVSAGSASVQFFYPPTGSINRFPLQVQNLLGPYFAGNSSATSVLGPLVGGLDAQSSFSVDDSDRSEGFA